MKVERRRHGVNVSVVTVVRSDPNWITALSLSLGSLDTAGLATPYDIHIVVADERLPSGQTSRCANWTLHTVSPIIDLPNLNKAAALALVGGVTTAPGLFFLEYDTVSFDLARLHRFLHGADIRARRNRTDGLTQDFLTTCDEVSTRRLGGLRVIDAPYFNSGVLLLRNACVRRLTDLWIELALDIAPNVGFSELAEQVSLGLAARGAGLQVGLLPRRYNQTYYRPSQAPAIVHYNSAGAAPENGRFKRDGLATLNDAATFIETLPDAPFWSAYGGRVVSLLRSPRAIDCHKLLTADISALDSNGPQPR